MKNGGSPPPSGPPAGKAINGSNGTYRNGANGSGANGGGPNGRNGTGHAGNGAKAGAAAALQQRAADRDFQQVLSKGLAIARRKLTMVAVFSLCANLLLLSLPIYLFQLSDRVYTSRSTDTLIMLSVVVVAAIAAFVFLGYDAPAHSHTGGGRD